jgi:hypothetical protein
MSAIDERIESVETYETTVWWAVFHSAAPEPRPLAFGVSEDEAKAAYIAALDEDSAPFIRKDFDRGYLFVARVAMRIALCNHADHIADDPELSWLEVGQ